MSPKALTLYASSLFSCSSLCSSFSHILASAAPSSRSPAGAASTHGFDDDDNRAIAAAAATAAAAASAAADAPSGSLPPGEVRPPLEEVLRLGSLWAEERKLYGHGSELLCCAADHGGRFLASACKVSASSGGGDTFTSLLLRHKSTVGIPFLPLNGALGGGSLACPAHCLWLLSLPP